MPRRPPRSSDSRAASTTTPTASPCAEALLIGARDAACAGVGERVEAVRSVAADLRLAAARLRAGTLPARGARAG